MTPKTFSAVAIGETFTHRGRTAIKISGTRYRFTTDATDRRGRSTTGTLKVNVPAIDRSQPTASQQKGDALKRIAERSGFSSWYQLELAAIRGERIIINGGGET